MDNCMHYCRYLSTEHLLLFIDNFIHSAKDCFSEAIARAAPTSNAKQMIRLSPPHVLEYGSRHT